MIVLGIETSTHASSVALGGPDGTVAARSTEHARGHVEFLMPAILGLCADAGAGLRSLGGIAVGIGPGLFTGMRVGIQTAKTLAQVLGVPLVGVCSLDVLALGAGRTPRMICACTDAKRGEMFTALYRPSADGVERIDEPRAAGAAALVAGLGARGEDVLYVGNGALAYREVLGTLEGCAFAPVEAAFPLARHLVRLALSRFARGETAAPAALEPLYVRRSDAEIRWEERGVVIERPYRVKVSKRAASGEP